MTSQPAPSAAPLPDDAPASSDAGFASRALAVIERQLALLSELAEAGVAMAGELPARLRAGPAASVPGAALAFDRLSRAVRLCILLQQKLIGQAQALRADAARLTSGAAAPAAQTAAAQVSATPMTQSPLAQPDGERELDEALERVEAAERELGERGDRLDTDDLRRIVDNHPFEAVVAMICRDLGLSPDLSALVQAECAREEAAGDGVGQPLAALKAWSAEQEAPRDRSRPRPVKPPGRWPRTASP